MGQIDWSTAGTRLRRTPPGPGDAGRNPDWNFRSQRWKVAEEYAAETLTAHDVVGNVGCPLCNVPVNAPCRDTRDNVMPPHHERNFAAGAALIAEGWTL